jgi:hypothetical protein
VVRNLKIWDIHYAFRPQVPSLVVENLDIYQASYGVYHPNFDNHFYKNVSISKTNTEPFNRGHDDLGVQYGLLAVDGLTFDDCRSGGMPLIQISDQNPTGKAQSHFKNLKVVNWNDKSGARAVVNLGGGPRLKPEFPHGVDVYVHYWFGDVNWIKNMTRSPQYIPTLAPFMGNIYVLRANHDGTFLHGNLLSDPTGDVFDPLRARYKRIIQENNMYIRLDQLLQPLLEQYEEIYLYDIACRVNYYDDRLKRRNVYALEQKPFLF